MSLLLSALLACHPPVPVASGDRDAAPTTPGGRSLPGLRDVACDSAGCVALCADGLVTLTDGRALVAPAIAAPFDTVRATNGGWELEGPCEQGRCAVTWTAEGLGAPAPRPAPALLLEDDPPGFGDDALRFAAAWNKGVAAGWRSGFHRVIVGPGEGRITWLRGMDGGGQLLRSGGGSRSVRLGGAASAVSFPGWLALHPTGVEAYLVAWPSPLVRAFDPGTLDIRWTLAVEGAARGLFVDPGGRWLVVVVGSTETDRSLDWPIPAPVADAPADPNRDELLRTVPGPPQTEVVVIDLALHVVAARARGSYRRFLPLDRPLLATDREVVTFQPGALP